MTTHVYDRSRAERLVPLLQSILRELRERQQAIAGLERSIEERQRGTGRESNADLLLVQLAEHNQGERDALRELAHLGCVLDDDYPMRVLIPGDDGEFASGFCFDALSGALEELSVASAR